MNIFEDFRHGVAKGARRNATNHASQNGVRAAFDPNVEVADVQTLNAAELKESRTKS